MRFLFLVMCSALFLYASATHFNWYGQLQERAEIVNNYQFQALALAKENRLLKLQINDLNYQIQSLKTKNDFLSLKQSSESSSAKRSIASVGPSKDYEDMVAYDVYKWSPEKLLAIGDREFQFKKYEASAQYYSELLERFPSHELVNDKILFKAGISAYESGQHNDWSKKYLSKLIEQYPKSSYYRGAKLWLALAHLQEGDKKNFYNTVEEFRLKYRNTNEWKILSKHYEEFTKKYNQ